MMKIDEVHRPDFRRPDRDEQRGEHSAAAI
jgi:hypothetical protein